MKDRIKAVRKAHGLNQREFAEVLCISKSAVESYEQGVRVPTSSAISLICEKFRIRREWLESGTGEMEYPPEDETAALVEEILGDPENPLFDIILATVKTYLALDHNDQEIIKNFAQDLLKNAEKKGQPEG